MAISEQLLQDLLQFSFANLLPAILLLVVGWVAGRFLEVAIKNFLKSWRIEKSLESFGISFLFLGKSLGAVIAWTVKWYLYLIFMQAALSVLGLTTLEEFIGSIVGIIPLVVKAFAILLIGLKVGEYLKSKLKSSSLPQAATLGTVAYFVCGYVAAIMALSEIFLRGTDLLIVIFAIILGSAGFGLALGFGLAVGLGAKDLVSDFVKKYTASAGKRRRR